MPPGCLWRVGIFLRRLRVRTSAGDEGSEKGWLELEPRGGDLGSPLRGVGEGRIRRAPPPSSGPVRFSPAPPQMSRVAGVQEAGGGQKSHPSFPNGQHPQQRPGSRQWDPTSPAPPLWNPFPCLPPERPQVSCGAHPVAPPSQRYDPPSPQQDPASDPQSQTAQGPMGL